MNQKLFIQKSDEILNSMSLEELRRCMHNIARKTPESNRDTFLQLLKDSYNQDEREDSKEKFNYKRLIPEERVQQKLKEIKETFDKLENGELYITAQGYEDYSNGYWDSEWIWEYEDNEGIGRKIEDAVLFAHDCINDCRYKEAVTIFKLVMDTQIYVEDEYGGDSFELDLEEMVNERLVGINLNILAQDVLYSNYQLHTAAQRASVLYSYFEYPYFMDIHIEDIFSVGREELRDTDMFFRSWIDLLMQQRGDVPSRLLKEGLLYYKGIEGLLEMARKGYKEHPSIYLATMQEYEKAHDYEKMKEVGKEALDRIENDLKIRGEIAIKAAQASHCVNDSEFMKKCWYEAFYSNSTVSNYLRLFADEGTIREYRISAKERIENLHISGSGYKSYISETDKNNVTEIDYRYLYFFSGHFDKIKNWCLEQKSPLGWSGTFIGYGVDLMLLYLYADNNLGKAGKKIEAQISNRIGFNESKNLVFMKENCAFETEVSVQNGVEIFWNIFSLWKANYSITADDIKSHVDWLESVIDKRIDGIVGGKYRNKYSDVALLAAALGEVKESLGLKMAKSMIIKKYHERYSRHTSFRGALKEYMY